MLYTSLNKIRAQGPCGIENESPPTGFRKLMAHLGKTKPDDEPVSFAEILASNGLADALWCLCSVDEPGFCRLLAVKFAREVQHLMRDPISPAALDVAERYARGEASAEELAQARATAYADAADAAAYAAAAYAAADASAYAAAAYAATYAAYAADPAKALAEVETKQAEIFLEMLNT